MAGSSRKAGTDTAEIDTYTAPVDVRVRAPPVKVFDKETSPPSKYYPDREANLLKEVFIEEGKRKVPRSDFDGRVFKGASKPQGQTWDDEPEKDKEVDICDSSLFEEDLNYVPPKPEFPGPYDPERARVLYRKACDMLGVIQSKLFLRSCGSGRVNAIYQGMGPVGARCVALSLISTLMVTELHMSGNKLGPAGMDCMAKLIHDNETIKVLGINDNELGREGGKILAACIKTNDSIQQINAAGNEFDDEVCKYLCEALEANSKIGQLDLSRNCIGSKGLKYIAKALETNNVVCTLDVSYNHIQCEGLRCWGYRGIQAMLKVNTGLLSLCLAWNGIHADAAKLLGNGMSENNTLSVLDLSGCRMTVEALVNFVMTSKENKNLKAFMIKDNPITNADLILLVRAIHSIPETAINFVDAGSVTVSGDFLDMVADVAKVRPGFVVTYRGLFSQKDMSRNMLETMDLTGGDPLEALIKYTKTKNLRLVDLFARIDQDKSGSVTRQELIHGVAEMGIPLSIKQMDKLVAKLDKDGDGEIDFGELLDGYKKFMRRLHKQGIVARTVLKQDEGYFPALKTDSTAPSEQQMQQQQQQQQQQQAHKKRRSTEGSLLGASAGPQLRRGSDEEGDEDDAGAYLTAAYGDPDVLSASNLAVSVESTQDQQPHELAFEYEIGLEEASSSQEQEPVAGAGGERKSIGTVPTIEFSVE